MWKVAFSFWNDGKILRANDFSEYCLVLNKKRKKVSRKVSMWILAVFIFAAPSILQDLPGQHYAETASPMVFFGTTTTTILNSTALQLSMNLTDVLPSPVNVTTSATVDSFPSNQTVAVDNSSVTLLEYKVPTIVNLVVAGLGSCTNYSVSIKVLSVSGSYIATTNTFYVFPCWTYSNALTLDSGLTGAAPCNGVCINATFTNNMNSPIRAVVFAVVHGESGATECVCTSSITIGAGDTESAYLVDTGLPAGQYNATIFAWDTNGVPISQPYLLAIN